MGRSNARGFSLLELVVVMAIVIVLAWLLFHALSSALLASRLQMQRDSEQSAIGRLVDNLTTEEDDAWAIYDPPSDVNGRSNSDGHEVDFFARDGQQRPYFWAYDYDKSTRMLTRYRFASPGGIPAQDTTYSGITNFYTQTYPVTALQDSRTPLYSTLYNGAVLQSGVVRFYRSMPWIAGGNNVTYVHIEGATVKQDLQLATTTAPSGFTVVVYYTPSPTPWPTPGVITVWPAAVKFAARGTTLAAATEPMHIVIAPLPNAGYGQLLNALLGGGVAYATRGCGLDCPKITPTPRATPTPKVTPTPVPTQPPGCCTPTPAPVPIATPTPTAAPTATPTLTPTTSTCTAIAYDASGTRIAPGAVDPYDSRYSAPTNGCWSTGSTAQFVVTENGYSEAFINPTNSGTCGGYIFPGGWLPTSAQGPTAAQEFSGGSIATAGTCTVVFQDATGQSVSAYAAVVTQCGNGTVPANGQCQFTQTWPGTDWVACQGDASTYYSPGTNGTDHTGSVMIDASSTGSGTISSNGSTYAFTRTSPGTVILDFEETWITNVVGRTLWGYPFCKGTKTSTKIIGTVTIE